MPNWVFTTMTIDGSEEDLLAFKKKAGKSYATHFRGSFVAKEDGSKTYDSEIIIEKVHESSLSFWNFVSPTDLDTYFSNSSVKPEGYEQMTQPEQLAHSLKFESDGWYDWNLRNWGTKWDAGDAYIVDSFPNDKNLLVYQFQTAWSPAQEAFAAMVEQHPTLKFRFDCEEEQGWGVEYEGTNGEIAVTNEWDIPESHADYVTRDNEEGCVCQSNEEEYWFKDCPKEDANDN